MTIAESAALGLLQGIAEFLPISSSGHLAVAKRLFGLGDVSLLFDIILHLATLAAVIIVFRKKIGELLACLWRWLRRENRDGDRDRLRMIFSIVLASACTAIIGLAVERLNPGENMRLVCSGFIVTAVLLVVAERLSALKTAGASGQVREPGPREGLIVGMAQGIGVFPGISRSGITISAALASGISKERAGEYSFLLSIPAILGAFLLKLKDFGELRSEVFIPVLAVGAIAAFAAGLLVIRLLLRLIQRGRLSWFALYLVPLGLLGLVFLG